MKQRITIVATAVLTVAVLLLLPNGCVSEFNAELPIKEDDILVVSGDIIENTEVDFVLSKSFSINSANPPAESQNVVATVTVVGSDGYQSSPATPMGKGVYRLAIGELKDDVAYGLRIGYYGNTYTSQPSTPLRTPEIDEISLAQPEEYGDVSLQVSTHDDTSSEPRYFIWNYQEDWEFPAWKYTRLYVHQLSQNLIIIDTVNYNYKYVCWKKNTVNELLIGTTEMLTENRLVNKELLNYPSGDERFRSLYCLTLTQKAISKEAYEYYKIKKTENEEMGGVFTPQPSETKGNIACQTDPSKRTIGYVSVVKNVVRKRIFVKDGEVTKRMIDSGCPLLSQNEAVAQQNALGYKTLEEFLLVQGMEPVGDWEWVTPQKIGMVIDGYTQKRCVDCTLAGGTKNKPDFWPNDKE